MINEVFPHQFSAQYNNNKAIEEEGYVLHYSDKSILLKEDDTLPVVPQRKDFAATINNEDAIYLFSLNGSSCFLYPDAPSSPPDNMDYHDINVFRTLPQELGWISILGFQLHNWHQSHRYCGRCASPTRLKEDERALVCSNCETTIYPTIAPAIIVAILCKDRILLARGANWPEGRFSLVAGYTDVGETLEETVVREVKEEVGLDVKNIRYYKNHPWPLSGSLMVGFIAEANDQQAIVIDDDEIAEAAWFSRDELPPHFPAISISGEMIDKFRKGEL